MLAACDLDPARECKHWGAIWSSRAWQAGIATGVGSA
jgi:hypothetical protein